MWVKNSLNQFCLFRYLCACCVSLLSLTWLVNHPNWLKSQAIRVKGWEPKSEGSGFCSICCCSVAQSCPILCNPMDCSPPGFPLRHLPEFVQSLILWAGDASQPSLIYLVRPIAEGALTGLQFCKYLKMAWASVQFLFLVILLPFT